MDAVTNALLLLCIIVDEMLFSSVRTCLYALSM